MPRPAKTYFTLREAFDFVGASIYGPKWRGFEADCDPAREKQQTDSKTLLRKLAPDGRSFSTKEKDRRPVPKRPIDDIHRVRFGRAIGRHIKALKELLRFLHKGTVPTEFIPENATTAREGITASDWPDPEKFNPKKPTWGDLWFNIAADRVVRNFPKTSSIPGHAHGADSLWWAYGGRAGRVEIDREALERALRPPEEAKEPRPDQQEKKAPKPRGRGGRKPGSGTYTAQDRLLWKKMEAALDRGEAKSVWDAAGQFAQNAPGTSIVENRRSRLARGYSGWDGT